MAQNRLERKRAFRVTKSGLTKPCPSVARRPSFVARMFKLIFKRGLFRDETRSKSWAGKPEPKPAAEPLVRYASAHVISIPYEPLMHSELKVRSCSEKNGDDDSDECDASWRQRQTHCINCEVLFFTSLSSLSCSAGRFCSLDCKTSFEYVHHLEHVLAVHTLQKNIDSFDSSSDEDGLDVEEFDLNQL
ncbi:uncharacterized protein PHALS_11219 [Plasmopara halstedii]|uniref:Uncharacterized protein n=1 Tax=Plasmopara halstedii TaxID=4781 RepID=A0A0P1AIQ3_PLAHL|nr:uncharacterized protein PHALS_11219 [Plasmopara halstedii]CEG41050.1 hypothetical protein PHALS_11219 [Plasmopara halstedii]|eukprot:XP_024577419.1 hypothetical protein PHALS_11219 [Plasmopara halstedii]